MQLPWTTSTLGPGFSAAVSSGRSYEIGFVPTGRGWGRGVGGGPAGVAVRARRHVRVMVIFSGCGHTDGFDDVSHIAWRIPERLDRLRLADPVHRSHFELVIAGCKLHRQSPFAEGIFAEVVPERRFRPGLSAVGPD